MKYDKKLRLLFVEDLESDYELAVILIRKEGIDFVSVRTDTEVDCNRQLYDFKPDLVVSDYSMPEFDGMRALKLCQKHDPLLPVIILTGSTNEEIAVECLKMGAIDYVIKEHITRLPFAVKEALEQIYAKKEKIAAEKIIGDKQALIESIYRSAPVGIGLVSERVFLEANDTLCRMLGYKKEELIGRNTRMIYPTDEDYNYVGEKKYSQIKESGMGTVETKFLKKDGKIIDVVLSSSAIDLNDLSKGVTCSVFDITEHKKALAQITHKAEVDAALSVVSSKILSEKIDNEPLANLITNYVKMLTRSKYAFISMVNSDQGVATMIMYTESNDEKGNKVNHQRNIIKNQEGIYDGLWGYALNTKTAFFTNEPDKHPASLNLPKNHIRINNFLAVPIVIQSELIAQIVLLNTDCVYNEQDIKTVSYFGEVYGMYLKELRTQKLLAIKDEMLLQAQKMDAIGRLAGGVAHDFNNMLQTISGYTELAFDAITDDGEIIRFLSEIRKASIRAAELTQQLLTFARKQQIKPLVVDANQYISSILGMLYRIIGENIELVWNPDSQIKNILIDPSQFSQIITNLIVNARDAISEIGKVVIETKQVTFNRLFCFHNPSYKEGDYICISVSDNGCGMNSETVDKIFEPFYTTKDVSKGVGLGLPTVFGIVSQNDGFIVVDSFIGEGSTFNIYFPVNNGLPVQEYDSDIKQQIPTGTENIVVVEDDKMILELIVTILQQLGYNVISYESPIKALGDIREKIDTIDLLLTDVMMPDMNGKQLYSKMIVMKPELKCIIMTGYSANIINDKFILKKDINFLQKPFTINRLASVIREVLDKKEMSENEVLH